MFKKMAKVAAGLALVAAPLALNASPVHAANTAICAIHGTVQLNPGIDPTTPMNGSFSFASTTIVCAGTVAGVASANASGNYTDTGAGGTFSGTYSTGTFLVGGSCSGAVSGSRTGSVVVASLSGGCSGTVVLQFTPGCPPAAPSVPITCATLDGSAVITA